MAITPIRGNNVPAVAARQASAVTLNALPQQASRSASANKVDAVFAVTRSAAASDNRQGTLPRGSLVDVLA